MLNQFWDRTVLYFCTYPTSLFLPWQWSCAMFNRFCHALSRGGGAFSWFLTAYTIVTADKKINTLLRLWMELTVVLSLPILSGSTREQDRLDYREFLVVPGSIREEDNREFESPCSFLRKFPFLFPVPVLFPIPCFSSCPLSSPPLGNPEESLFLRVIVQWNASLIK